MWFANLICLFLFIKVSLARSLDEVQILKKSFAEGLQADPLLSGDVLTLELKMFIDTKIARMDHLLSSTRFRQPQRTKRDLNTLDKTSTIEIRKEGELLSTKLRDLRLSNQKNRTLAIALENPDLLAIYNYQNATFTKLLNMTVAFQTNLATIPLENSTLIVLGDKRSVRVIEFDLKNAVLKVIHTIRVTNPQHVVLWEQSRTVFLSVTWQKVSSNVVTVYKWLGRHFDFLQDIEESVGVVKSVPFSIHGSVYLILVNSEIKKPFKKSYSDIFKFNHDNESFKLFRKLPTDGCRDIKYFQARLHGVDQHFLVVVHGMRDSFNDQQSISVIYKYEDGYFYPFQTVESDAVEWQPIQDNSSNTALIALTSQGLKGFQYDGWQFSQSNVTSDFFIDGTVEAFHTFHTNLKDVLVMACSQCNLPSNVYTFNFNSTNLVKKQHDDLLTWCQNTLQQLDSVYYESESPSSRTLSAGSLRGDLTEKFTTSDKEHQLAAINQLNHSLTILEESVKEIFDHDWNFTNIQANKVVFNNKTSINFLQTNLINNQSVDHLLDNLLNLEEGFDLDELDVEIAVLENDVEFLMVNNRSVDDYVLSNSDSVVVQEMVVGNSANFTQGLELLLINQKIRVNDEELLLNHGDQVFSWDLNVDALVADQLNTTNGSDYIDLEVSKVNYLEVDNLEVGGLINRVDFPLLAAGSLKKTSNTTQVLHVPLHVNELEAESITVVQPPADFLLVDHPGNYTINRNVTFSKIHIANLQTHSINNIQISQLEGGFNLLQNTEQDEQIIKGNLTLDNVKITNLTRHNVSSAGNIKVLHHLTANDIISSSGQSLRTKLLTSLKLTDQKVSVRLHFTQPVEAYDVIADKVNEVEPQIWLLQKSDDTQVVTGQKRFLGDLNLNGTQNIFNLNDINVQEFENGLLKIDGDQQISGHFAIDRVVFKQGLQYNESNITAIKTMIVKGNLKVANTTTSELTVWGLVNNQNLNNSNSDLTNSRLKNFTTLYVDNLNLGPSELLDLLQDIHNDHLVLNHQHLQLPNSVEIQNLKFSGKLNGNMTQDDFKGLMTLQPDEDTLVATDMEYDSMTVLGEVFITDGYINGHNLTRLEKETVKIDEDHEFHKVTFDENIIVEGGVTVEGNIENLDLDEIVTQDDPELYLEKKIFKGSVVVNGTLFIKNQVSGLELNKFCAISNSSNTLNRLVIEGDVMFAKGPKVHTLNNMDLQHLKKSVWFSDVSANISGSLRLGNVTIQAPLSVKNYVDDVNWNNLIQNYFSKTKPQEIPGSFTFAQVVFKSLCSPQMNVNTINNITIDDILKVLLLQDVDQIFEEVAYLEKVSVPELYENVLVNGLSLKSDVMRYDQINMVTGPKIVENLTVDNLKLSHNVRIQGVDVLDWLGNAVLTSGSFNIKTPKTFKNATFEQGLSLKGSLNNLKFDSASVMLVDKPQKVRGRKVFTGSGVKVEKLKTSGLINGIDLEVLVANQATTHGNTSINSDLVFSGNLRVDNLNLHGQEYNGVNVTQLIGNLTKLRKLGGLSSNFDSLLNMSDSIERALADEQFLFGDFKEVNQFTGVKDIFGVKCHDGSSKLVTYSLQNDAGMLQIFDLNNFALIKRLDTSRLTFIQPITLQGLDYLYTEQYSHTDYYRRSTPIYYGNLLSPAFEYVDEFYMAPTVSLTSFTHPATNETCMVFVSWNFKLADVFCSREFPSQFGLKRKISMEGVYKVAALETGQGVVYLFLVGKGTAPFRESQVKILKFHSGQEEFENVQVVYESALLNDLAVATINGKHYAAFSFESLKSSSEPGWVSIFRLVPESDRFEHWQRIPVKNPHDVEFITRATFEPLLLVSTSEVGDSLNIFRYEGVAGFRRILKGAALPVGSRLRVIGDGNFMALMEADKKVATILSTITRRV